MVYMDALQEELIKQRDIHLQPDTDGADVAHNAVALLTGADSIIDVHAISNQCISVTYDLRRITRRIIEEALQEVGISLDNSLLHKMRRAIYDYTEDTQLENLDCIHDQSKSTLEVFINRYNQRTHGCRDERPKYYHHYN